MSTFREFNSGFMLGQQLATDRRQKQARAQASALAGGGDYDGAEAALMAEGMHDEAGAWAMAGERTKARRREQAYGDAYRTGGYKGVKEAAGREGDIGMAADMETAINSMDDRERGEAALRAKFFGEAAYGLSQIQDPAQRQSALMEIVETSGKAYGITPEQASQFDLSDENLQHTYEMSMSVAERLELKHRGDREEVEDERWGKMFGLQEEELQLKRDELAAKKDAAKAPNVGDEGAVRKEYLGQAGEFIKQRDAMARIASADATPAGDMALVFSYMKLMDPSSSVRETEYANAQNATGVPGWLRNQWNKLVDGQFLNADQRADFKGQAGKIYEAAELGYGETFNLYRDIAAESGLDPMRSIPDLRIYDFSDFIGSTGGGGGGDATARKQQLKEIMGTGAPAGGNLPAGWTPPRASGGGSPAPRVSKPRGYLGPE